jgi:hypothetical protein
MPQADVHRLLVKHKYALPLVVVAQSSQCNDYLRRVVIPLVRAAALGKIARTAFDPGFTFWAGVSRPASTEDCVGGGGAAWAYCRFAGKGQPAIAVALHELLTRVWK